MQKQILILALLMLVIKASAQFSDDFTDGDFTHNPSWTGDTLKFEVNTAKQLHLVSTGADTSVLVTQSNFILKSEWSIWVKLSFNTSVNNFARIYLASDCSLLNGPLNGYYIQLGGSDDSLSFVRQSGDQTTVLFRGDHSCLNHSTNTLRIKMIHDSTGIWKLYTDDSGGMNFSEEGEAPDTIVKTATWFGIYCHYTSSNATKFYFDEIYAGPVRTDTIPPGIDSLSLADPSTLEVVFTENVDINSAGNNLNYSTRSDGNPVSATPDPANGAKVTLVFGQPFPEGASDTLSVSGISDRSGNLMVPEVLPFSNYHEKAYDVVMDEIMADPEPVHGLPQSEYVELYNRTRFPVSLKGWSFEYSSTTKTFPAVTIAPESYLILTKGVMMNYYGPCVDLFTSITTLSNEGTALVLRNASGKVIHAVTYSPAWYGDPLKEDGGWSLEMVDPGNPCGCTGNWKVSVDVKGGTPGSINSVHASNPDTVKPFMERTRLLSDSLLEVLFSESMDSITLASTDRWRINDSTCAPAGVTPEGPEYTSVLLNLTKPFEQKQLYTLSCLQPPSDCAGNLLDTSITVKAGIPDSILPGDLVINEILPNPASDGERFVELYNRSGKVINLQQLVLGGFDSITNSATDLKIITAESFLSFAGDYTVLTRDPQDIQKRYRCPARGEFILMASMPSMGNDDGHVSLAKFNNGEVIDFVHYTSQMYSVMLTSTDGVSLERLNPGLRSDDPGNWHSASESCGFATPGYQNSQYLTIQTGPDPVCLSPAVFTPDDDGKDDLLLVHFSLDKPGYQASVTIYDAAGKLVRNLSKNVLLSTEDAVTWDGRDDRNLKSAVGIYILLIELVQPEGKIRRLKKTAVLGGRR
ncbi:MAG: lamin tail domain-containing protein [Bacteroidetes bacterium]|nr:lamin tail domain-containing protein [Bacteroidota bacterium]